MNQNPLSKRVQEMLALPAAPAPALRRTRQVFLAMLIFSNLSQIPILLTVSGSSMLAVGLAILGVLTVIVSAIWQVRRDKPHPALDIVNCCALLLVGATRGTFSPVVAVVFPS